MISGRNTRATALKVVIGSTVAITPLMFSATQAFAQEQEQVVEDIVVTAQKREERLRDIPLSVAALSEEDLQVRGIQSVSDLGRQTPGVVLNRRQDNSANVVIRGIGSFGNTQGVGFYIDDVQTFTDQTMRLQDLERVEILKGPQGTLYGGNNIGGAIKYVSKKPVLEEFSGDASVELGSRDFLDLYGSVNAPLGTLAAVRVSGYRTHDDGYIKNTFLGIDAAAYTEWGVRGQLLLKPSDDFRALLTFRHRQLKGGSQNYSSQSDINNPEYESNTDVANFQNRKSSSVVMDLEYDFGPVTLTSLSSYTHLQVRSSQDADYTPIPIRVSEALNPRPSKVYTQELRLTSAPSDTFDWIVGGYFARQDNVNQLTAPFSFFIPILGFGFDPALDFTVRQKDLAAFGTANLHLGDFTITGGLRYQDTKYTYRGLFRAPIFGADVAKLVNSDEVLLPRLSLSYKTENDTLLYATVSRGYEPGKVNIVDLAGGQPPSPYAAETTWAYEVGVKGDFGRQLRYDIALFYTKYKDRQVEIRSLDPVTGISERIDNIGESTSKGVEVNAVWSPVKRLDLTGAVAYTDAKWTDAVFDPGVLDLVLDGDRVPNAPEWTLNLAADYSVPVLSDMQVTFHADANYMSKTRFKLVDTGPTTFIPSRWVANIRLGFGPEDGGWEIAGRIDNLFNEEYFDEFTPQGLGLQDPDGTCAGCHAGAPASPRRYLISARAKF